MVGLIVLLLGIALLSGAAGLATGLHRRYDLPYALLSVGMITYLLALVVQIGLLRLSRGTVLGVWPIRALTVGLIIGFTEETARLLGYQYLARSAETRPQALMIGLGHGFTLTIYTGIVALAFGLSLIGRGYHSGDIDSILGGALAEAFNGFLPIFMHMALSWIVLHVFLRGELGWLFLAIFFHSTAEGTAALTGPSDSWAVVVWRTLIAAISLFIILRLRPPKPDKI